MLLDRAGIGVVLSKYVVSVTAGVVVAGIEVCALVLDWHGRMMTLFTKDSFGIYFALAGHEGYFRWS